MPAARNNGEEDDDRVPQYVPERFAKDLGGALSHHLTHRVDHPGAIHLMRNESQYPIEKAQLTMPPFVPPRITRQHPVRLVVDFCTTNKKMRVSESNKYEFWPFGFFDEKEQKYRYAIPGPFIRVRVGDVLQVNFTNLDDSGMAHSVDFHAVLGPGGGAPTNFAEQDET